ncbi:hypothetical protein NEOLEDRAFT_1137663 [Neolentinus lepideus HHB14362 ss-1]|uniref:Uncharacterized protein n=1 Tax=Neolentinus lepideus HHB14362 ss-1 TaxID=1314782 RepID=A0A165QND2_9AGAM|nr:hypothetical protein NEOLEDRAFT_1137663 [Neolentinus lepideus HHB14362 ss-1]
MSSQTSAPSKAIRVKPDLDNQSLAGQHSTLTTEQIDEKVLAAKARLVEAAAQFDAMISKYGQLRNATLPISRLPDNTLTTIFKECLAEVYGGSAFLFPLGHVCTKWRRATIRMPRLWTKIWYPRSVKLTEEIIKRSGSLPLEVLLRSHYATQGDRALISLVLACMDRIHSLAFDFGSLGIRKTLPC